jgi:hypothetical protein
MSLHALESAIPDFYPGMDFNHAQAEARRLERILISLIEDAKSCEQKAELTDALDRVRTAMKRPPVTVA